MSGVASRAINMVMRLSLSAALPLSSCASRVPAPVGDVPILAYYETDLAIQLSGGETLPRKLGKSKTTKIFEAKAYIKEAGFVGTDVVVSVKDGPYSVLKAGEALAKFRVARSDYANSTGNGIEV